MMTWFKSHSNSLLPFGPHCSSSGHRHPELCSYRKSRDVPGVTPQLPLSLISLCSQTWGNSLFCFRNPWKSLKRNRSLWMGNHSLQQGGHRIQGSFTGKLSTGVGSGLNPPGPFLLVSYSKCGVIQSLLCEPDPAGKKE